MPFTSYQPIHGTHKVNNKFTISVSEIHHHCLPPLFINLITSIHLPVSAGFSMRRHRKRTASNTGNAKILNKNFYHLTCGTPNKRTPNQTIYII